MGLGRAALGSHLVHAEHNGQPLLDGVAHQPLGVEHEPLHDIDHEQAAVC